MIKNKMFQNKVLQNARWIILCKIVQSVVQLVVGMLSARYLGPFNYGLINYASSVVAFFVPIMQLGLQSTLVQEYVNNPESEGKILGTSLVMTTVSSIMCIIGAICFATVANGDEKTTIIVCALYSVSLFFQSVEMMQYWFQAKLLSKYSSVAMLSAYVVVSVYKIYLLVLQKSVYWFSVSHSIEYAVTSGLLFIAYKRYGTQAMSFSWEEAKRLFSRSKHYITATLMVVVYNSVGNVMLKLLIGETENGYFAAAVMCGCVMKFVFMAIIDSARPAILESRQQSQAAFEKNMSRLYSVILYMALAQSVCFTIFAKLIVKILYGTAYMPAVPVLQILTWNGAFSYMGSVRNIWILGEEKHSVLWIINLGGAIANVILNLCFIPMWGARGAALASVLTQIFTNFILGFILKPIRPNNKLLLKGLNPKMLIEMLAMVKRG